MAALETIEKSDLTEVALALIIARAVRVSAFPGINKWDVYEEGKRDIVRANPTPEQYQRAIALLTEALKI